MHEAKLYVFLCVKASSRWGSNGSNKNSKSIWFCLCEKPLDPKPTASLRGRDRQPAWANYAFKTKRNAEMDDL